MEAREFREILYQRKIPAIPILCDGASAFVFIELTHLAEPGGTIMANCVLITSALIVLEFVNLVYQINCIGKLSYCCTELHC